MKNIFFIALVINFLFYTHPTYTDQKQCLLCKKILQKTDLVILYVTQLSYCFSCFFIIYKNNEDTPFYPSQVTHYGTFQPSTSPINLLKETEEHYEEVFSPKEKIQIEADPFIDAIWELDFKDISKIKKKKKKRYFFVEKELFQLFNKSILHKWLKYKTEYGIQNLTPIDEKYEEVFYKKNFFLILTDTTFLLIDAEGKEKPCQETFPQEEKQDVKLFLKKNGFKTVKEKEKDE